jgi:hypothetical protein
LFDDEKNNEEWAFLHVGEINKLSSVGQVQKKLEVYKIVALVYLQVITPRFCSSPNIARA